MLIQMRATRDRGSTLNLHEIDEAPLHCEPCVDCDSHAGIVTDATPLSLQQADGLRVHRPAGCIEHRLQIPVDKEQLCLGCNQLGGEIGLDLHQHANNGK